MFLEILPRVEEEEKPFLDELPVEEPLDFDDEEDDDEDDEDWDDEDEED